MALVTKPTLKPTTKPKTKIKQTKALTHTCTHTHTHTYMHMHTHMHTHAHTHSFRGNVLAGRLYVNLQPGLMASLANVLASVECSTAARQQGGLQLKNCILGQHGIIRDEERHRWTQVSEKIRTHIKQCALNTLGTETSRPSTAAQVYAAVSTIEVPMGMWDDAVPMLLARLDEQNVTEELTVSVLEAIGYLTGDITEIVRVKWKLKEGASSHLFSLVHDWLLRQSFSFIDAACSCPFCVLRALSPPLPNFAACFVSRLCPPAPHLAEPRGAAATRQRDSHSSDWRNGVWSRA